MNERSHFQGAGVLTHLAEARERGREASRESHGLERADPAMGAADGSKEGALIVLLSWIIGDAVGLTHTIMLQVALLLFLGFAIWKIGRSALLGWARLERINRLIEEEKHEIERNREEEKLELKEMYRAKGFLGKLLDEVITVLMADDSKLLGIMLEEELGVSLESYEHPLKIAIGVAIGLFITGTILFGALFFGGTLLSVLLTAFALIGISSYLMARLDRIRTLQAVVWNLATTALASGATYFLTRFFIPGGLFS